MEKIFDNHDFRLLARAVLFFHMLKRGKKAQKNWAALFPEQFFIGMSEAPAKD
jgi:hypothetical protein